MNRPQLIQCLAPILAPHSHGDEDFVQRVADAVLGCTPRAGPEHHFLDVLGNHLEWDLEEGVFLFGGVPAVMMWTDTTLAGLMSGMHEMVGTKRFGLALRKLGRTSVEQDWAVISAAPTFEQGFANLAKIAAASGWGQWTLLECDREKRRMVFEARNSWEAGLQKHLDVEWGVHFMAGKYAGYAGKLFGCNCWSVDTTPHDSPENVSIFEACPSERSLESELRGLLESDEATRADFAVAVQDLSVEVERRSRVEEDLREAKAAAEQADRAKSEFLANMSHELRTPMNGVMGMLELLQDAGLDPDNQAMARTAYRSSAALLDILNGILDLSKVEAGRIELADEPLDVFEVMLDTVEMLRPLANDKGLTLSARSKAGARPWIRGDAGRIRQVLLNLVGNALKFTDSGCVQLELIPGPAATGGEIGLAFNVRDTGIGIPEEAQEEIFEVFTQADSSSTRQHGGTGLGLSISRSLARAMGGELSVVSELGVGSCFTLHLTLARSAPDVPSLLRSTNSPASTEPLDLDVLVVEDNGANRDLLRLMLSKLGCRMVEAGNGLEALSLLELGSYDVVLMDLQMPRMGGLRATREIRAREQDGQHQQIIAMTAHSMRGDRERCLEAGMDDYLSKPLTRGTLEAKLARVRVALSKL